MKRIICIVILGLGVIFQAQTKLIAHKSAGGSNSNFIEGLPNTSNEVKKGMGMIPNKIVTNAVLDSLIFIDDSVAVMVTSYYCEATRNKSDKKKENLWRKGKDTVYQHELFSNQHELDKIKKVLKEEYFFNNSDSTVFIGYDNEKINCDSISLSDSTFISRKKGPTQTKESRMIPISNHWLLGLLVLGFSLVIKKVLLNK